ncbi:MAG: hypothetical protein JGK01_12205 [Microcoleus sp. PH2017_03_ELD_O_A]|nr:hypothetical protein [Microcoleus sp. PH2017_04_SCI_O_A]MCC3442537.1 hypothetical protein [Microcoleus sp. PH2017_03_ELD_O_A]MCC3466567.1 hypothetical protein [Microcoleus sp. PH2017_06_SFM_O_A]MCC3513150.1 hypothetical protein [Microcoleus sp. PH2017_17_BER_D_A]
MTNKSHFHRPDGELFSQLAVCSWQFASVIGKVRSAYNELGESQFCFKSASVPARLVIEASGDDRLVIEASGDDRLVIEASGDARTTT